MKTRISFLSSLLVLVIGLAVSPAAYAYDGPPEQQNTPSDACANDPFGAYWDGDRCGGDSWSPMSCTECVNNTNDGCITKPSDGAGGCFFENGQCYGWGSCHYTG